VVLWNITAMVAETAPQLTGATDAAIRGQARHPG